MLRAIQHIRSSLKWALCIICFSGSSSSEDEPGISLQEQGSVCLLSQDKHCLSSPAAKWEAEARELSKLRGWCQSGSRRSPRGPSGLPCAEEAASEILPRKDKCPFHLWRDQVQFHENVYFFLLTWEPSFIDNPRKLKFKVQLKPLHFQIVKNTLLSLLP